MRFTYRGRRFYEDRVRHSYRESTPKVGDSNPDLLAAGRRARREAARERERAKRQAFKEEVARRDPSPREPKWRRSTRLSAIGLQGPGGGATDVIDVPMMFRSTTMHACGMFPWVSGDTHPMIGTPHGSQIANGRTFCYDPVSATYRSRIQNTPSAFILGLPSFGKSTLARKIFAGEIAAGRTPMAFADTKGEYVKLVEEVGGVVVRLGHGHGHLNPLAVGALGSIVPRLEAAGRVDLAKQVMADVLARRRRLVQGLCEIERGEPLRQIERNILGRALRLLDDDDRFGPDNPPLISDLSRFIEEPPAALVRAARIRDISDTDAYADTVRELLATLDALLDGDLGTVFAGQTTQPLDLTDQPPTAVCVDISSLSASEDKLLAAVMFACWEDGFGAVEAAHILADAELAPQRNFLTVIDELWRVLNAGPGMVERINATTRLTRTLGTALLMITHTVKDLESLAEASDIKKAKGFIERAGAVIVGALPREEMEALDLIVPFTSTDKDLVSSWSTPGMRDPDTGQESASPGRGCFLLKIGSQRVPGVAFRTELTPIEIANKWHDTDARFATAA